MIAAAATTGLFSFVAAETLAAGLACVIFGMALEKFLPKK